MAELSSGLARSRLAVAGRDGAHGGRRLRLTEVRGWQLAHLRVFPAGHHEFQQRIRTFIGTELPVDLYRGVTHGGSRMVRITDDQYWWVAANREPMLQFARELPSPFGTLTMLSASRVRIRICGPAARDLLAKGIALDLHPSVFQPGDSALTGLHHTGVFLECIDSDCYELYVPRTYAQSIWEWLVDAALPFGYDLGLDVHTPT